MLECKDIMPRDKDGKRHGYWERYYSNGNIIFKGSYHHGTPHGYWENYYSNGKLWYKGTYHYGEEYIGYWITNNIRSYYARM